jgi:hypothetical protein
MRLSPSRRLESRRLLVAGSVCWIIIGLDLREPLHADGVDLRDPVLEGGALELIFDLAIPQGAFKGDELPLLERLGELREIVVFPLPVENGLRGAVLFRECAKLWGGLISGDEMDNQAGI